MLVDWGVTMPTPLEQQQQQQQRTTTTENLSLFVCTQHSQIVPRVGFEETIISGQEN